VQSFALFVVEVIMNVRQHFVHGHQLDDFAFREIRRFIEDQSTVSHAGLESSHDHDSNPPHDGVPSPR
jgi:hypothetical protein